MIFELQEYTPPGTPIAVVEHLKDTAVKTVHQYAANYAAENNLEDMHIEVTLDDTVQDTIRATAALAHTKLEDCAHGALFYCVVTLPPNEHRLRVTANTSLGLRLYNFIATDYPNIWLCV